MNMLIGWLSSGSWQPGWELIGLIFTLWVSFRAERSSHDAGGIESQPLISSSGLSIAVVGFACFIGGLISSGLQAYLFKHAHSDGLQLTLWMMFGAKFLVLALIRFGGLVDGQARIIGFLTLLFGCFLGWMVILV